MSTIQFKSTAFNQAVAQQPKTPEKPAEGTEQGKVNNNPTIDFKGQPSAKDQINSQIIDSIRVSMGAEKQPLDLLYKTAVEEINKILGQAYAVDGVAVEGYLQQQMQEDNSSKATAERILKFSLGMFASYAEQNPELEGEALATKFISVIRGGFETGYNEAAKILEGLSVFDGSIKSDIEETYRLVMQGYDDFIKQHSSTPAEGEAAATAE